MAAGDAEINALIDDLRALLEMEPAARVRALGEWLDNSGAATSIRTRLSVVRALAAHEAFVQQQPGTKELVELFGLRATTAYALVAKGRDIVNERAVNTHSE